jgi:hypothetical protein
MNFLCLAALTCCLLIIDGQAMFSDTPTTYNNVTITWMGGSALICQAENMPGAYPCTDNSPYVLVHSDGTPGPAAGRHNR